MDKREPNEGFRVLDDFVCEATHDPAIPQGASNQQGQNEGMRIVEELSPDIAQTPCSEENSAAEGLCFQFSIEFDPFGIPPGFKDRFQTALREEAVLGKGLKCYLGALGGNRFTYGFIWRPGGNITLEDRRVFEEWLRTQLVRCKVALGDPEPMESSDINREVTERVFELDNLSAADRQAAAEWKERVLAKLPNKPDERAEPL